MDLFTDTQSLEYLFLNPYLESPMKMLKKWRLLVQVILLFSVFGIAACGIDPKNYKEENSKSEHHEDDDHDEDDHDNDHRNWYYTEVTVQIQKILLENRTIQSKLLDAEHNKVPLPDNLTIVIVDQTHFEHTRLSLLKINDVVEVKGTWNRHQKTFKASEVEYKTSR